MRAKRVPKYTHDLDGREVVLVPLLNHPSPAQVYADDFRHLMDLGFSDQWTFNRVGNSGHSYVRAGCSERQGKLVTVARLLLSPARGLAVRYRDGNKANLRRSNLYIQRGFGFSGEAEAKLVFSREFAAEYRSAA